MRPILACLAIIVLGCGVASAAQPSFIDGLFGVRHPAPHRVVHKPAKKPVKPAKASPAKPAAAAPIPMPRPRPEMRAAAPAAAPAAPPVTTSPAPDISPLPRPRPADANPAASTPPAAAPASEAAAPDDHAEPAKPASPPKPPRVFQTACPAVMSGQVEAKPLPPINQGMCQEQSPLSVSGVLVNGRMVPLSTPVTVGCPLATQLPGWASDIDSYLATREKTSLKRLDIGGSFECRDRNVEGGSSDLSEHGRADAIDLNGFTFADGRKLSVDPDYRSTDPETSRFMHFAHDAACTRFTTVLGPDANALHHDHFHVDLGCHGKTCTYRLCE